MKKIDYDLAKRTQISTLAINGAKLGNLGRMCESCAFKFNSAANIEPENVDAAWECVAFGGTFNCHIEAGIDKGCECVGFKYAKAFFDSLKDE